MAQPRKLQTLSLKRKIDLIHEVENNQQKKRKDIARDFKIPPSTLTTILKDKEKYKRLYFSSETNATKQRDRKSVHDGIDQGLLDWFANARSANVPVSGPLLKQKAEEISQKIGILGWCCTDSWLTRFKKRHAIVFKTMSGERYSVNEQDTNAWTENVLKPTLSRYPAKDIFNADESGLFWRLLPDKTLSFKSEKCHGGKKSKERFTFLVCTNLDGTEKMSLFTVGRFKKPRCFSGLKTLPVEYSANRKAWMTMDLFKDWLTKFDHSMHSQKRKVLLVVDNCSAHGKIQPQLKATELLFLPANATTKLQPLDQGIIQNIKVHYRTANLMKLITHIDGGKPTEDFHITLLEAMTMLKEAWDRVTPSTIRNCFRKAGFVTTSSGSTPSKQSSVEDSCSEPLLFRLCREWNVTAEDYFCVDADLQTSSTNSAADTTTYCQQPPASSAATASDDSDSDNDDCGEPETVTQKEVLDSVQKINRYCMQFSGTRVLLDQFHVFTESLNKCMAVFKTQTKIPQFFGKKCTEKEEPEEDECDDVKSRYDKKCSDKVGSENEDEKSQEEVKNEKKENERNQMNDSYTEKNDKQEEKGVSETMKSETQHKSECGEKGQGDGTESEDDDRKLDDTKDKRKEGDAVRKEKRKEEDAVRKGERQEEDAVHVTGYEVGPQEMFIPTNASWRERQCAYLGLSEPLTLPERNFQAILGDPKHVSSIVGDGNCLYRALSLEICGTQTLHKEIRAIIVDFMCSKREQFSQYIGTSVEEYLEENTLKLGSWGSDVEIVAAAALLQTTIVVYTALPSTTRMWLSYKPLFPVALKNISEEKIYLRNLCQHFERVLCVF